MIRPLSICRGLARYLLCSGIALVASCSDVHTELLPASNGSSMDAAVDASGDASSDTGGHDGDDAATDASLPTQCGPHVCKCDDGQDNDHDGLTDGEDPECTASFDNDEGSFATGKPKAGPNACEDCFWDANNDAMDDDCAYSAMCRTEGAPADMVPAMPAGMGAAMMCRSCDVSARCADSCRPHTPNGCDCFGCCEVTRQDGTQAHLFLGDECSLDKIDDERKCPSCVPSAACNNPCGPCELCLGKKPEDLPTECMDAGVSSNAPQHQCDEGYQACSASTPCADGYYCVLGCCLVAVF